MARPADINDGDVPGAAWFNAIKNQVYAWEENVNAGGFSLSNLGEVVFSSTSGRLDLSGKNISNIGQMSFSPGGKFASSVQLAGTLRIEPIHGGNGGSWLTFNSFDDNGTNKALLSGHRAGYLEISNLGITLAITNGVQTEGFALTTLLQCLTFDVNGRPSFPNCPTSPAGLMSGMMWRDPADGNKLKLVP